MTITPTEQAKTTDTAEPLELLIKEARAASRRRRLGWFTVFSAVALVACLIAVLIVGSSKPPSKVGNGDSPPLAITATLACNTFEKAEQATVAPGASGNAATIIDSYSTTAKNLEVWLKSFMPMADPAVIQKLPSSARVSACVLQGSWVLPSGGSAGSADERFEVVMIGPDGTAAPVLFGPSAIVTAAAPEVG